MTTIETRTDNTATLPGSRSPRRNAWKGMQLPFILANFGLTALVLAFALLWSIDLVDDFNASKAKLTTATIDDKKSSAGTPTIPDGFINSPHPDAPNLQVIGVQHTASRFPEFAPAIIAGIDKAEVVLLERGNGYFDTIGAYALAHGKTVYYVDRTGREDVDNLPEILPIALLFGTLILLANLPMSRAWHIPVYVFPIFVFMSASFPNPFDNFLDRHGQAELIRYYSASWITEGRTIKMSDKAIELAHGRKAILIEGNWHADGVFWYHDHPGVQRFQRLYQSVFWWWVPTSSNAEVGFPDKTKPVRTRNGN